MQKRGVHIPATALLIFFVRNSHGISARRSKKVLVTPPMSSLLASQTAVSAPSANIRGPYCSNYSRAPGVSARYSEVSRISPGAVALTTTPCGSSRRASAQVSNRSHAFDCAYAAIPS